jgi:phosphonopyruvate decarboxylase
VVLPTRVAPSQGVSADSFLESARARGFDFYSGVPCSFLTPIINRVIGDREVTYVAAASEGEAVAIAAGAWVAGRRTVVMGQNSGLGNMVNPLTSLNFPFRIPTLLLVTWRGQPGLGDEPQHELMGQITGTLLDTLRVPHQPFPRTEGAIAGALDGAVAAMERTRLPFAFIMERDTVCGDGLEQPPPVSRPHGTRRDFGTRGVRPSRAAVLERLLARVPDDAGVIATTGKCGRELFTLADRPQHLYQVGSMGCASAMGLGVALNTHRPIVVLDGDGAALMKLGALATIGAYAPRNLVHIVLDNGVHDSTGGQRTVSASVEFADIALACGYATGTLCDELTGFDTAFSAATTTAGPHLVHVRIAPGSIANLGRPTVAPSDVVGRFQRFLGGA